MATDTVDPAWTASVKARGGSLSWILDAAGIPKRVGVFLTSDGKHVYEDAPVGQYLTDLATQASDQANIAAGNLAEVATSISDGARRTLWLGAAVLAAWWLFTRRR